MNCTYFLAASTIWPRRQLSALSSLEMLDHHADPGPSQDATPTHSSNPWLFLTVSCSSKGQGRWPDLRAHNADSCSSSEAVRRTHCRGPQTCWISMLTQSYPEEWLVTNSHCVLFQSAISLLFTNDIHEEYFQHNASQALIFRYKLCFLIPIPWGTHFSR